MASIGGDTNVLLRKFMKRKRKPTPADRTAKLPKPGQGSKTTYSRSSTPPIPGFGQFQRQFNRNSERSWKKLRQKYPNLPARPPKR